MSEHHKVKVVRVNEILPHNGADTLGIVHIGGYQCVVKKDNYKPGDLAVYIPPDSVVPASSQFSFLWADRAFEGEVPLKYRRITVRRFRKEWSEGLLLPISDFGVWIPGSKNYGIYPIDKKNPNDIVITGEGDNVAELLGITHYEEPEPFSLGEQGRKLTLWQKILKFFGFTPKPYGPKNGPGKYDVESLKHYPRVFTEGEEVIVTEKVHGSNARYMFDGKTFWVGSHNKWWKTKNNIWWQVAEKYPWIEAFCRAWPKFTLRGEVTPTQGGYPYAADHEGNTEKQFFVFDVQKPDGSYMDKEHLFYSTEMKLFVAQLVPVIYKGPYSAEKMKELAEGPSKVDGTKHIREGVVVSSLEERQVRGVGRAQLKLKSLKFLEKEAGK